MIGSAIAAIVALVAFCRDGFLVSFFIETTLLWRLECDEVLRPSLS
jgi:hypothetical protein